MVSYRYKHLLSLNSTYLAQFLKLNGTFFTDQMAVGTLIHIILDMSAVFTFILV